MNNHHKIPWQEHPKGQAERKAMALSSRYEIRCDQQWIHMVDHPCRTKQAAGEERERPARPCLQQQSSALGGGRMRGGSEALFWLVSCFLSLPIPRSSSQMFSVSRPVAGGGGRARDAFAVVVREGSWCGRRWCRWLEAGMQAFSSGELYARNIHTQRGRPNYCIKRG